MIRVCAQCGSSNRVPARRVGDRARCGSCKAPILPLEAPIAIDSPADFEELVTTSPLPVLVDFWASWCGPCKMVAPELAKLARQLGGKVVVAKVDTDALPQVGGRYGVQSLPTMVLFGGGKELRRVSGAMPAASIAQALGL